MLIDDNARPVLRVLVVDDSQDDADLCVRELQRSGHRVEHARVDNAIRLSMAMDIQDWDVVLCDYTMPSFSGREALELIRKRDQNLPFVFVSGTLGEENAVAAMQAGAQDYVTKTNLGRLPSAVQRAMSESRARREAAQREAERAIAEARFRRILEMAPDAMLVVDDDARIALANPAAAEILGAPPEEMEGRILDEVELPETGHGRKSDVLERTLIRRDGRRIMVEVSVSTLDDKSGPMRLAAIRDTTERHALEAQLRQAQKMEAVGQLAGGIAHDMNNMLTAVLGYLELMQFEIKHNTEALSLADRALDAGRRGAKLIRQLLAFSRRQVLQPENFLISEQLEGTLDLLRRLIGPQIEIGLDAEDDSGPSFLDRAQFDSAIANLAINARDAMPGGGRIDIKIRREVIDGSGLIDAGEYVRVTVEDTGSGICAENLEKVFEPFFTTKAEGKGSGLGLSMVFGFVKQSGGHVEIDSTLGVGTRIHLIFPRVEGAPYRDAVDERESGLAGPNVRILLVDDDPSVVEVAELALRKLGHDVVVARSGVDALAILHRDPTFELLFTDIIMPDGLLGTELAARAMELRPNIRVLFTSGNSEMASAGGANILKEVGLLLPKPWRLEELRRFIEEAIS